MDVTAAFPSVARGCLLRKMRSAGVDKCLVRWTDSFMRDRRVAMGLDGQEGEEAAVTTGLPQGSPASPVLFAIYITEIHQAVESQVEDSRCICFVDDVTWLVEGVDVSDVVRKLGQCASASLEWAQGNAVRFETAKTEAILLSRKRRHRRCQVPIRAGDQTIRFAPEATRWLGIWLDAPGEPAEAHWEDPPGRGQDPAHCQPVRCSPCGGTEPLASPCAGDDAIRLRAHMGWSWGALRGSASALSTVWLGPR